MEPECDAGHHIHIKQFAAGKYASSGPPPPTGNTVYSAGEAANDVEAPSQSLDGTGEPRHSHGVPRSEMGPPIPRRRQFPTAPGRIVVARCPGAHAAPQGRSVDRVIPASGSAQIVGGTSFYNEPGNGFDRGHGYPYDFGGVEIEGLRNARIWDPITAPSHRPRP
jgi:hypothetical protein